MEKVVALMFLTFAFGCETPLKVEVGCVRARGKGPCSSPSPSKGETWKLCFLWHAESEAAAGGEKCPGICPQQHFHSSGDRPRVASRL